MFWLKACPRCRGDLYRSRGDGGRTLSCLQCGHEIEGLNARKLRRTAWGDRGLPTA